jgi:hypothetical protein
MDSSDGFLIWQGMHVRPSRRLSSHPRSVVCEAPASLSLNHSPAAHDASAERISTGGITMGENREGSTMRGSTEESIIMGGITAMGRITTAGGSTGRSIVGGIVTMGNRTPAGTAPMRHSMSKCRTLKGQRRYVIHSGVW